MPNLDFYFDFSSPYSYIASERIEELAARHGYHVSWKPILLGVIFKTTGGVPLTMGHPWRAKYSVMDFARSAEFHGVPFRMPSRFPQPTQNAARALLWLQRNAPDKAVAFLHEAFRELFARDGDLSAPETLERLARAVGADPQAVAAGTQDPQIKQALVELNEEAARLEIFGAPTVVVDGEKFWGADRLPYVERRLQRSAAHTAK
ncbi:MAG TPA: 2-hydroxychromene-2-carboxylate isomerase [Burkholderiaceae bacterium]|nr:2-hydroxychromene-2-carboxylate isomerase [Burkholderiaceae bacterium]